MSTYDSPFGFTSGSVVGSPFSPPTYTESQEYAVFETSDNESFETVDNKIFYVKR